MSKTARLLGLLALWLLPCFFSSCATDVPQESDRVSTIPWNRPEKWEGQGPLGGFNQGH